MSVRICISFETADELQTILARLDPTAHGLRLSKIYQTGRFQRLYIDQKKGLTENKCGGKMESNVCSSNRLHDPVNPS